MERIISPSMLSADFGHLDRDTRMIDESAAQWIHIDVMDGVFVPNISFGFPVMKPIRRASAKFLDVHLMIVEPEKYLKRFAEAGADLVTFHYEATQDPLGAIRILKECGVKAGISVKPATPVEVLEELLPELDLVLVMSVEPGFGGQTFMADMMPKLGEGASVAPHDRRARTVGADRDRRRGFGGQCGRSFRRGLRCAGGRQCGVRRRRSQGGDREDAGGAALPLTKGRRALPVRALRPREGVACASCHSVCPCRSGAMLPLRKGAVLKRRNTDDFSR